MPKCPVCGKHVKISNNLHLWSHQMAAQEYLARFPESVMSYVNFRRKRSDVMKARWADPEIREQVTESRRRIRLSEPKEIGLRVEQQQRATL